MKMGFIVGGEQLDLPQDGHARRCGYTHVKKSSVELHPLSVRDTVSHTHTHTPEIVLKTFVPCFSSHSATNAPSPPHLQLRRLRLRQRQRAAGALSEGVCQNHGLPS